MRHGTRRPANLLHLLLFNDLMEHSGELIQGNALHVKPLLVTGVSCWRVKEALTGIRWAIKGKGAKCM